MLTVDNISDFLAKANLLDRGSVVFGTFRATSAARRNKNILVEQARSGYLVKQSDPTSPDGALRTASEAAFSRICHNHPAFAELSKHIPKLIYYIPSGNVVVLELIKHAAPLWTQTFSNSPDLLGRLPKQLGRLLGSLHQSASKILEEPVFSWVERSLPWILMVNRPHPSMLAMMSVSHLSTLRIIQGELVWSKAIDAVRKEWRVDTLIHGDIKSDNILVQQSADNASEVMWLVDWETVQAGDSAWDVAGVLQDFLMHWIQSMPVASSLTPGQMASQAQLPLRSLQPLMRAFWHSYRSARQLSCREQSVMLLRSVRYTACRLIQCAFELSQNSVALPGRSVLLLQLSANILSDPESSQVQLFGIPEDPAF